MKSVPVEHDCAHSAQCYHSDILRICLEGLHTDQDKLVI